VLGLIFLEEKTNLSSEAGIILAIIATVFLSVFVHGVSTAPGIKLYVKSLEKLPPGAPEGMDLSTSAYRSSRSESL
jgi:hypothetical protein